MPGMAAGQISLVGCEFVRAPEIIDDVTLNFTLDALNGIGRACETGVAVTEAFEKLLTTEYIPWWTASDVATLSISFIVAFSKELTPRLDINHTIRSRQLPAQDITWLRTLPQTIVGGLGTWIAFYQDGIV